MSEIKVNSIKGTGASTAAITVNSSDGTCTANITNNLSNRNIIINGAMQVAQRGTSSTTNGYASLDRFRNVYNNTDANVTQSQVDVASGTTPYTLGFRKALRITNGNQVNGDNGDTNIQIWQRIESQNIANSGWNYLSASSFVTLQFWVKSSVAQNFNCYVLNEDTTQNTFPFETGSLSANTWTKITKTIPGNSNLTFNNDTGTGLRVAICAFMGTNRTSNSLSNDTWTTFDGNNFTKDFTTTWLTTNNATFEITGVQLELGSVATDFEHMSFAQDLHLCKRYFQIWNKDGDSGSTHFLYSGAYTSHASSAFFDYTYQPEMRATPSATTPSTSYQSGGSWSLYEYRARWIASATHSGSGAVFNSQVDFDAEL